MGDSGSLSLGATLAVVALITGHILVLPIIALLPVSEAVSDIIQVILF
jgi:phospho-N-acetylmuramoyl-pentapeptide-transferase